MVIEKYKLVQSSKPAPSCGGKSPQRPQFWLGTRTTFTPCFALVSRFRNVFAQYILVWCSYHFFLKNKNKNYKHIHLCSFTSLHNFNVWENESGIAIRNKHNDKLWCKVMYVYILLSTLQNYLLLFTVRLYIIRTDNILKMPVFFPCHLICPASLY